MLCLPKIATLHIRSEPDLEKSTWIGEGFSTPVMCPFSSSNPRSSLCTLPSLCIVQPKMSCLRQRLYFIFKPKRSVKDKMVKKNPTCNSPQKEKPENKTYFSVWSFSLEAWHSVIWEKKSQATLFSERTSRFGCSRGPAMELAHWRGRKGGQSQGLMIVLRLLFIG